MRYVVLSMLFMGLGCRTETLVDPEVVKEADRVFARQTAARGVDGWIDAFASDGKLVSGAGVTEGLDAIRAAMAVLDDPGYSLTWEPVYAEASGDLGYTHGTYRRESLDSDGNPVVETGRYVTIFRRDASGAWKVVLDIGNPAP